MTGVPLDMVQAVTRVNESAQKTMSSGRLFMSKMGDLCRKLQLVLAEAYKEIYGDANVKFFLVPMSRLEINSVADLKVLFDAGCLTPDMSLQLSSLLLGDEIQNKRRRMQMGVRGNVDDAAELDQKGLKRLKQEGAREEQGKKPTGQGAESARNTKGKSEEPSARKGAAGKPHG